MFQDIKKVVGLLTALAIPQLPAENFCGRSTNPAFAADYKRVQEYLSINTNGGADTPLPALGAMPAVNYPSNASKSLLNAVLATIDDNAANQRITCALATQLSGLRSKISRMPDSLLCATLCRSR